MRVNTIFIILCFIGTFYVWRNGDGSMVLAYSFNSVVLNYHWWTPITALFLHGSSLHFFGNALFMVLFGYPLEKILGKWKYTVCFLTGGVFSFLFSRIIYPADMLMVGASGAICTIIAMVMLYDPWKLSFVLMGFPMPLGVAGLSYLILNYWLSIRSQGLHNRESFHVAYYAHILGFVAGIFFSIIWNPEWKKNLLVSLLLFILYYVGLLLLIKYFAFF